jgi:hypothetical protein
VGVDGQVSRVGDAQLAEIRVVAHRRARQIHRPEALAPEARGDDGVADRIRLLPLEHRRARGAHGDAEHEDHGEHQPHRGHIPPLPGSEVNRIPCGTTLLVAGRRGRIRISGHPSFIASGRPDSNRGPPPPKGLKGRPEGFRDVPPCPRDGAWRLGSRHEPGPEVGTPRDRTFGRKCGRFAADDGVRSLSELE